MAAGAGSGDGVAYTKLGRNAWDTKRDRYPFCVVWSPIPVLTWLLPFIGHAGVTDSSGTTYDFAGPYTVSRNNMLFGRPTRVWQLDPSKMRGAEGKSREEQAAMWDDALQRTVCAYEQRWYNFFCDNCHSMVAVFLQVVRYNGLPHWNMAMIAFACFLFGRLIDVWRSVQTFVPPLLTWTLIYFMSRNATSATT